MALADHLLESVTAKRGARTLSGRKPAPAGRERSRPKAANGDLDRWASQVPKLRSKWLKENPF